MIRLLPIVLALAACGDKTFPSLCKDQVPPPAACMTMCDPKPGAPQTCPSGFFCDPDGTCNAECVPGADQTGSGGCGSGYTCLPNGTCVNTSDCTDIACKVVACEAQGKPATTISGQVFAPNGTLPLYGINVYVPDTDPGPMVEGVNCDRCTDSLPGNPIGKPTITDENGKFTLTDMPSGVPVPLVIQSGKWRRIVKLPMVTQCADNPVTVADTTLPKSMTDMTPNTTSVHMPQIAISTGSADALECLPLKLGIDPKEITSDTQGGRIHLFADTGATGGEGAASFKAGFGGGTGNFSDSKSALWSDLTKMKTYDIIINSCEGAQFPETKDQSELDNLKMYADIGGRVFLSHWHNIWIEGSTEGGGNQKPMVWPTIAQWSNAGNLPDPATDLIDETDNPKGPSFAQWMLNVGGSTTRDQVTVNQGRSTVQSVDKAKAELWTTFQGDGTPQNFQFTTPNEADPGSRCGKVVFSDMHVSAGSTSDPGTPYPGGCSTQPMTAQEKALAFMFFDISSCVGTIF